MARSRGLAPKGIIVPMVTPFDIQEGSPLNRKVLGEFVNYLIDGGVHALLPLGTSGEFAMLSESERNEVIQGTVEAAKGRVPVIAGVSAPSTELAVKLGRDARDRGADAVVSTGPFYFTTNDEGLERHFQALMDKVDLPLVVYNIPSFAGYNIDPKIVKKLAERNSDRLAGVKVTTYDMKILLSYLEELKGTQVSILTGADALILTALDKGASGAVVGVANVIPKETSAIYENFVKGRHREAEQIEQRIYALTQAIGLGTFPAALKEAVRLMGIQCGGVRSPLEELSDEERKEVRRALGWKLSASR